MQGSWDRFFARAAWPVACSPLSLIAYPPPLLSAPRQHHENGARHKQNVENFFKEKRDKKLQGEARGVHRQLLLRFPSLGPSRGIARGGDSGHTYHT